jgi:hypothetical protein
LPTFSSFNVESSLTSAGKDSYVLELDEVDVDEVGQVTDVVVACTHSETTGVGVTTGTAGITFPFIVHVSVWVLVRGETFAVELALLQVEVLALELPESSDPNISI